MAPRPVAAARDHRYHRGHVPCGRWLDAGWRLGVGETLFVQDEAATAFYVLLAGRVKIAQVAAESHQVVIRYIAPSEVFGAVPLFTQTGYPVSALWPHRSRDPNYICMVSVGEGDARQWPMNTTNPCRLSCSKRQSG